MKVFAVICALLVAGISAETHASSEELTLRQQRFISELIKSYIEEAMQAIRDRGLDPYHLEKEFYSYELPVASILSASADVEDVRLVGLSNIVINRLSFATLATRLTFDLELPRLEGSLGKVDAQAGFFGYEVDGQGSGSVVLTGVRVAGNVRVNVGIASGISIRSMELDFSLRGVESNINLVILGHDLSAPMNQLIGELVPTALEDFRADLNQLLEIVLLDLINGILENLL